MLTIALSDSSGTLQVESFSCSAGVGNGTSVQNPIPNNYGWKRGRKTPKGLVALAALAICSKAKRESVRLSGNRKSLAGLLYDACYEKKLNWKSKLLGRLELYALIEAHYKEGTYEAKFAESYVSEIESFRIEFNHKDVSDDHGELFRLATNLGAGPAFSRQIRLAAILSQKLAYLPIRTIASFQNFVRMA